MVRRISLKVAKCGNTGKIDMHDFIGAYSSNYRSQDELLIYKDAKIIFFWGQMLLLEAFVRARP